MRSEVEVGTIQAVNLMLTFVEVEEGKRGMAKAQ